MEKGNFLYRREVSGRVLQRHIDLMRPECKSCDGNFCLCAADDSRDAACLRAFLHDFLRVRHVCRVCQPVRLPVLGRGKGNGRACLRLLPQRGILGESGAYPIQPHRELRARLRKIIRRILCLELVGMGSLPDRIVKMDCSCAAGKPAYFRISRAVHAHLQLCHAHAVIKGKRDCDLRIRPSSGQGNAVFQNGFIRLRLVFPVSVQCLSGRNRHGSRALDLVSISTCLCKPALEGIACLCWIWQRAVSRVIGYGHVRLAVFSCRALIIKGHRISVYRPRCLQRNIRRITCGSKGKAFGRCTAAVYLPARKSVARLCRIADRCGRAVGMLFRPCGKRRAGQAAVGYLIFIGRPRRLQRDSRIIICRAKGKVFGCCAAVYLPATKGVARFGGIANLCGRAVGMLCRL